MAYDDDYRDETAPEDEGGDAALQRESEDAGGLGQVGPPTGEPSAERMPAGDEGVDSPSPTRAEGASGGGVGVAALVVLLVALVLSSTAAVKFYLDLSAANQALTATATTLASLAGAAAQRSRLDEVVSHVARHRYSDVARGMQELAGQVASAAQAGAASQGGQPGPAGRLGPGPLGSGPRPRPGLGGGLQQQEEVQVSPEAEKFLKAHPRLLRRLLALAQAARELDKQGKDVAPLRKIRDQILAAAAAGDGAKVDKLLKEFEVAVTEMGGRVTSPGRGGRGPRGRSAGPEGVPPRLRAKLERLKKALDQARRQGKDVRAALMLARQSAEAAAQGDMKKAEELLDKALRAVAHAPRARRSRRGPRGRKPGGKQGPGMNPLQVLDMLFSMVKAEDQDLGQAYDSVENADLALREKNQDQIHELLAIGKQALERISKRREKVSAALRQPPQRPKGKPGGAGRPGGRPGRQGPGGPGSAGGPPGPRGSEMARLPLPERLAAFLEEVRKMPEEEFEANKHRLAGVVFAMFLPPPPKGPATQINQEAADLVRKKLRLAYGPFIQRQVAGEDLSDVAELFRQAREALYAGKIDQANELVDQALGLLGLLEESGQPAESQPSGTEGTATVPSESPVSSAPEKPSPTTPAPAPGATTPSASAGAGASDTSSTPAPSPQSDATQPSSGSSAPAPLPTVELKLRPSSGSRPLAQPKSEPASTGAAAAAN